MAVFPDEVLLDIFQYFRSSESDGPGLFPQHSSTLRTLCLVSRQFRRVAEPILYHTVFLYTPTLERWGENNERTQPTILHTLMRNPALGRHIRKINSTVCPLRTDRIMAEVRRPQLRLGVDENYSTKVSAWIDILCLQNLGLHDFEGWPYLISVVLALAPRVESLIMTLTDGNSSLGPLFEFLAICGRCFFENKLAVHDRGRDAILSSALGPTRADSEIKLLAPLLELSSLELVGDAPGHNSDYAVPTSLGIFALPQLRNFTTTALDWEELRSFRERWEAYDSSQPATNDVEHIKQMYSLSTNQHASMKTLNLYDSRTHHPEDLRLILQHCQNLESLALRLDNTHAMVNYASYGQVLAQYGQGLRRLDLYAEPTSNDAWEGRDIPTIGNLRVQMPRLVQLRVFLARLIGTEGGRDAMPDPPDIANHLPAGLRWLWLVIGHPLHYKQVILDFLETAPERMPALEWVVIQDAHSHIIPFQSSQFRTRVYNKAKRMRALGRIVGPGRHDLGPIPPEWERAFRTK